MGENFRDVFPVCACLYPDSQAPQRFLKNRIESSPVLKSYAKEGTATGVAGKATIGNGLKAFEDMTRDMGDVDKAFGDDDNDIWAGALKSRKPFDFDFDDEGGFGAALDDDGDLDFGRSIGKAGRRKSKPSALPPDFDDFDDVGFGGGDMDQDPDVQQFHRDQAPKRAGRRSGKALRR